MSKRVNSHQSRKKNVMKIRNQKATNNRLKRNNAEKELAQIQNNARRSISTNNDNNEDLELFESIHCGCVTPTLPNRSWAVHRVEVPKKYIAVSELAIRYESEIGVTPFYRKQVVFDEKFNYELFLIHSKATITNVPYTVKNISDIAAIIKFVDNIKLCVGGPEFGSYPIMNLECAYRDPNDRWRHNLCSLEVTIGDICDSCTSLNRILSKKLKRSAKDRISNPPAKQKK